MSRARVVGTLCLVAAMMLLSMGGANAAICGFPGLVASGLAAGGTNYVVLFFVAPPFGWSGTGTVPIGGVLGDPCRDIWRDALLGPAPPNFQAIYAPAPAACAAGGCAGPAICTFPGAGGASLCISF